MIDYRLYLVTDDPSRYAGNWIDNVVAAVEGGVTCVQYRDTESSRQEQYERILKLRDAIGKTPIIVNNDAELAAAVKAEGVHVGQRDMPVAEVREIVGNSCEIGLSITAVSQLTDSATDLADCLGIGPVFDARKTKADASEAMGVEGLREIVWRLHGSSRSDSAPGDSSSRSDSAPGDGALWRGGAEFQGRSDSVATRRTVAIGGITLENAASVLATGVGGIAVVSAFSKSPDPYAVARSFRKLF